MHNACNWELKWSKGSFDSSLSSIKSHFIKHGANVGATDVESYLRKAEGFKQNLKGATKFKVPRATPGVMRHKKNGKYIDLAPDGKIVSFGKQ